MNTKLSLVLLIIVSGILATACAPMVAGSSAPIDPVQPLSNDTAGLVPVIGASAPVVPRSDSQEPRLWSGSIFLSDNGNPDYIQNIQVPVKQNLQSECASDDSLPKDQSGCIE